MWLWVKTVVPWRTPKFCKTGVSTPIPIWTYSWKLLEWFLMTLYIFIYLIKVCEDVFNVFTHIHSVAVPQSANLESPTARWWQRKGRAGSFQGAQRVGFVPNLSSLEFNHVQPTPKWSCFDHSNGGFIWVLHGFFMGFDPWGIQNFSKPKPSSHGTWRGVASWASQLAWLNLPERRPQGRIEDLAGESSIFGGQNHGTAGTMIPSGTSGTCSPKFRDL